MILTSCYNSDEWRSLLPQLQAGARPPPQSRDTVNKTRKIAELKRRFMANEITLQEYISGLAGHTNLVA